MGSDDGGSTARSRQSQDNLGQIQEEEGGDDLDDLEEDDREEAFMSKAEQDAEERANLFRDPSKNYEKY